MNNQSELSLQKQWQHLVFSLLGGSDIVYTISPVEVTKQRKLIAEQSYTEFMEIFQAHKEAVVREAKIQGMQSAKSRVLRRTEIPKDAKNPTRDHIVYLGEHIADIIQQDIDKLTHPQAGGGLGNE